LFFTDASFALFCMLMKFGIAIAAKIPMMTTTTMSSIRVNPLFFIFCLLKAKNGEIVKLERKMCPRALSGYHKTTRLNL